MTIQDIFNSWITFILLFVIAVAIIASIDTRKKQK